MNDHLISQRHDKVALEAVKFHAQKFLGAYAMDTMRVEQFIDQFTGDLVMSLRTRIMSEVTKKEEVTNRFRYPATWFQHLKYDHAPRWILKRFPVRWRHESITTTVKHYMGLPKFSLALPPKETESSFAFFGKEPIPQEAFSRDS